MTISTYAELKTALQNEFGLASSDRQDEALELALKKLNMTLRIRAMESSVVIPLNAANDCGTAGGTANAITCTGTTTLSSYALGTTVKVKIATTNTSTVTINIDSVGVKNIRKGIDGGDGLEADDLIAGATFDLYYDGTQFVMIPPGGAPLPARHQATENIYLPGDPKAALEAVPRDHFWRMYMSSQTGKPQAYTIEGENYIFGPAADASYFPRILYWRAFATISGSSTNWLIDHASGLWFYAACVEMVVREGNDPRLPTFAALYDDWLATVISADKKDRYPQPMVRRNNVPRDVRR